jgi:L-aminopeptidase/D-esterase-like protein
MEEKPMMKAGRTNSLMDIEGTLAGHFTSVKGAGGSTLVICPKGATAGANVRERAFLFDD